MTYSEALSFIHRTDWKGSRLGLERIRELLSRLGDPQKRLKFVHVAGTNGKGSVSSMLCSVLTEAGYRTGLFTSPFLVEFRERIRSGETLISEEQLIEAVLCVQDAVNSMEDAPTEFELMTAIGFWYFEKMQCDVVVCEVGLGGELDSTNVIEASLLSVITSIALDHTKELGDTVALVARAKAGIIKEGAPVLFGESENREALAVIREVAESKNAALSLVNASDLFVHETTLSETRFSYGKYSDLLLSLIGSYQPKNAAIAVEAVEILNTRGLCISEDALRQGLRKAAWQGRFEVLSKDPVIIMDGAHNPHGAAALAASLDACFDKDARFLALCAVMADKEYPALFSAVSSRLDRVFCVAPEGIARALDAKKLAAECSEFGLLAKSFPTVEEGARAAYEAAVAEGRPLLVFGSLYLYREARAALLQLL